jgi:hypothetical protein
MRTISLAITAVLAFGGLAASSASAAPAPQSNSVTCFDANSDGYGGGACTRQGNKFTLSNTTGYSGVYVQNQSLAGTVAKTLTLSFAYSGATSGGSPRFSIPIDTDGNLNTVEGYLYADTACDANHDGVINLAEPGCIVADSFGYYGPLSAYPSTNKVANDYTFIIADEPGTVTVSQVDLARTPPGKAK